MKKVVLSRLNTCDYIFSDYDIIIPVPIQPLSYWKRGFNQAKMLAAYIARIYSISIEDTLLKQRINLKKQKTLNKEERKTRKKRFSLTTFPRSLKRLRRAILKLPPVENLNILLVDDVATTLQTLDDISKLLIYSGAHRVDCLTLARTLFTESPFSKPHTDAHRDIPPRVHV